MLKTCFGLSSLRGGVNVIAVINMVLSFCELYSQSHQHLFEYMDPELTSGSKNTLFINQENDITILETWLDKKVVMTDVIYFMWTSLVFATNICLKQSTFKPAPHKIYTWLVINYATLLCCVIYLTSYATLLTKVEFYVVLHKLNHEYFGTFVYYILIIITLTFEIFVIHSYYIEQQKAMSTGVIQIKWRPVPMKNIVSQGTAYTGA